jgi:hypothetical protein
MLGLTLEGIVKVGAGYNRTTNDVLEKGRYT